MARVHVTHFASFGSVVLALTVRGGLAGAGVDADFVQGKLKVHLWDDGNPYKKREQMYNDEGWATNEDTTLVNTADLADVIVWITTMTRVEKEIAPLEYDNVIVLDYADGCSIHPQRHKLKKSHVYFKRSWTRRIDGQFAHTCIRNPSKTEFPFAYSGAEALVQPMRPLAPKQYRIICTLRITGQHNKNRKRIVDWTQEFVKTHGIKDAAVQNVGHGYSGSNWPQDYLKQLSSTRIIVTCNPNDWEGDFRLWESMLSGALVFVDHMYVMTLLPNRLEHKKHLILYNSQNQTEFNGLLHYYYTHPDEAAEIAAAGHLHTLKHHMPRHRVDWILGKAIKSGVLNTKTGPAVAAWRRIQVHQLHKKRRSQETVPPNR